MAMSNPAFTRSPAFQAPNTAVAALSAAELQKLYEGPDATGHDTDRMTIEDTIVKTVVSFAILVATAVIGWMFPAVMIPAMIVGFVLALVNIFKKEPSPGLILLYAAAQGLFIGGISQVFEQMFAGIVTQAVLATLAVVGVTLALFASGKIRASKKATKVFLIVMVGYLVFSLINFALIGFGTIQSPFGLRDSVTIFGIPLGIVLGILAVLLGAYSLVLDFDFIQRGVANRAPRKFGWKGAFGIMVTVIWLYVELLRMFAIARD